MLDGYSCVATQPDGASYSPTLVASVEKQLDGAGPMSPYGLAKRISAVVGRSIKPQMCYNYAQKGYIKTRRDAANRIVVDVDEARRFMLKYAAANM
jgi:hypothetical protein